MNQDFKMVLFTHTQKPEILDIYECNLSAYEIVVFQKNSELECWQKCIISHYPLIKATS